MARKQQLKGPFLEREGLDDFFMVTQYTSGEGVQSNPSLEALAGVRVVATLLGHSRKKRLYSHALTQVDHQDRPPCISKDADHTYSNTL